MRVFWLSSSLVELVGADRVSPLLIAFQEMGAGLKPAPRGLTRGLE